MSQSQTPADTMDQSNQSQTYESKVKQYIRGRQLGYGGFAVCYQVLRRSDNRKFAMKVMKICDNNDKSSRQNSNQKSQGSQKMSTVQKVKAQAKIISGLKHSNIIKYETQFFDKSSFYLIMELCQNGTLNDVMKKRRTLTQIQARYYIAQIVNALTYLKDQKIIHREYIFAQSSLKPANFLLDSHMKLKVSDFGLATYVDLKHQKSMSVCGTPNYISPQMVMRKGYSYQVDIWSVGVILYTMLYGMPPFETKTKNASQTYEKIKNNEYNLQSLNVSKQARSLISKILVTDPWKRIKLQQIMSHPFFNNFNIPFSLPVSYLSNEPNKIFIDEFNKVIPEESRRNKSHKIKQRFSEIIGFQNPRSVNVLRTDMSVKYTQTSMNKQDSVQSIQKQRKYAQQIKQKNNTIMMEQNRQVKEQNQLLTSSPLQIQTPRTQKTVASYKACLTALINQAIQTNLPKAQQTPRQHITTPHQNMQIKSTLSFQERLKEKAKLILMEKKQLSFDIYQYPDDDIPDLVPKWKLNCRA